MPPRNRMSENAEKDNESITTDVADQAPVTEADLLEKIQELQHLNFSLCTANCTLNNENLHLKANQVPEGYVAIELQNISTLIDQHTEYKAEIVALVSVFQNFTGLFGEDTGFLSLAATIPKMLKNPELKAHVAAIMPIIEKYTAKTAENNG